MGLAAPKNRTRISNDPQNTHWAGNTSRFGHRILTSQGWTPGSSLGAKDAAHSAHYTVASHSHIRVLLKEDNLGLGAKRGSERAENFGLAGLESVLGRLNGNEEEVKKEEARREEIEKRAYVYRKFGFMNFVSGGYLVGDKIEKTIKKEEVGIKAEPQSDSETTAKKRKRDDKDTPEIKDEDSEEPKLKRKKKSMNLREEAAKEDASKPKKEREDKKDKSKKDKKKGKKDKKSTTSDPEPDSTSDAPTPASDPEPLTEKARRKVEKRARKEEKKLKKALKKAAKKAAKSKSENSDASSESEDEETSSSAPTSTAATGTSTPVVSAVGLTFGAGGRHAVRQRYIRQKKMASMDPQALKEIFMIKTPS